MKPIPTLHIKQMLKNEKQMILLSLNFRCAFRLLFSLPTPIRFTSEINTGHIKTHVTVLTLISIEIDYHVLSDITLVLLCECE
jgi:hypothetical protein